MITGRGPNTANAVSHSNRRVKRRQLPNLQWKRIWVPSEQRFVRLRVSTSALRLIDKLGVERVLRDLAPPGARSRRVTRLPR